MQQPFTRDPSLLSKSALEKANAAKFRLVHHYKQLVEECSDREQRRREALDQVEQSWTVEKKRRHIDRLSKKESEFLRLRRVRLGAEDFSTVKVIGKVS